jgi:hypothetical protein
VSTNLPFQRDIRYSHLRLCDHAATDTSLRPGIGGQQGARERQARERRVAKRSVTPASSSTAPISTTCSTSRPVRGRLVAAGVECVLVVVGAGAISAVADPLAVVVVVAELDPVVAVAVAPAEPAVELELEPDELVLVGGSATGGLGVRCAPLLTAPDVTVVVDCVVVLDWASTAGAATAAPAATAQQVSSTRASPVRRR